jgi:hypothetical protein
MDLKVGLLYARIIFGQWVEVNRFNDVMCMQIIGKLEMGGLFIVQHLLCAKRGWCFCMKGIGKLEGLVKFSWVYRGATLIFESV